MGTVLIAYISKAGSTKEIAEEIGRVLGENGIQTELQELPKVQDLSLYSAVVIGAPINGFRWLPEAEKFIEDHKDRLEKIQTAYFIVSYLLKAGRASLRKKMGETLKKAKSILTPVAEGYFGGRVDANFPAIFRLMFGVKKGTPLDVRDWDEIRAWAAELAVRLKKD